KAGVGEAVVGEAGMWYGTTYIDVLSSIASYLGTNVCIKRTNLSLQYLYDYSLMTHSKLAHDHIRGYLDKYVLLSSKRNDYLDWCAAID
ncbi:hypothetical protein HDU81_004916, partial [Chytriomyces hyalinus]